MKNLQRYLEFLLDPLIGGHRGEADNLVLLLQMLDTITTSYEDALEPTSTRVHVTARVARQVGARARAPVFSICLIFIPRRIGRNDAQPRHISAYVSCQFHLFARDNGCKMRVFRVCW